MLFAQFFKSNLVFDNEIGGYQDLVSYCDYCLLLSPSANKALVFATQIGMFRS